MKCLEDLPSLFTAGEGREIFDCSEILALAKMSRRRLRASGARHIYYADY